MESRRRRGTRGSRDGRRSLRPVLPGGTDTPATGLSRTAGPAGEPRTTPIRTAPRPAAPPAPGADAPDSARLREQSETFVAEDEVLAEIRGRSTEAGLTPVGTGSAAALSFLAAATAARAVVEVGTGLGAGTVSLLRGMPSDGLLTSIDVEADYQRRTRATCADAGFGPGRLRMITGRALEVLPRLSDAAYDLVVVDGVTTEYPHYVTEAIRLLRHGGVVVVDHALWNGRIADPVRREAVTSALRETTRVVREDERLVPLMLPLSDGLLCAARR